MENLLTGRVAVVTGGASGIGRAIALKFATHGADVVIADIREEPREEGTPTHERINSETHSRAKFMNCDVTDVNSIETTVGAADEYGGIDIMVNNAGLYRKKPFLDVREKDYAQTMELNVKGVFFGAQSAAKRMVESGNGSIINMSSNAGIQGGDEISTYCTSKGAVRILSYSLAKELGPSGIRVNTIHPGYIRTTMTTEDEQDIGHGNDAELLGDIPMERFGEPDDVANAALYLASDLAAYVTAESIVVDGGLTNTTH